MNVPAPFNAAAAGALALNRVAELTAANTVQLAQADSVVCIGVTIDQDPDTFTTTLAGPGAIAQVTSDGSGVIAAGDKLRACANGKVKTANPADGATARQCIGIALTAAAATDGLLVDALLTLNGYVGA